MVLPFPMTSPSLSATYLTRPVKSSYKDNPSGEAFRLRGVRSEVSSVLKQASAVGCHTSLTTNGQRSTAGQVGTGNLMRLSSTRFDRPTSLILTRIYAENVCYTGYALLQCTVARLAMIGKGSLGDTFWTWPTMTSHATYIDSSFVSCSARSIDLSLRSVPQPLEE